MSMQHRTQAQMQPQGQNAPATEEQQRVALQLNTNPVRPLAVPTQLMTMDPQPQPFAVEIHEELTKQLKSYADPTMFERLMNNLGPDNTGVNFIRRLSVVAGGAPMFQEPRTPNGQQGAMHQELIAVMPLIQQTRRRFTAQFGTQGADRIPDCTAVNVTRNRTSDVGFGNPGGLCVTCPHDVFIEGQGRQCRERHAVFALAAGSPFPYYLDMSVYSNRPIMDMLTNLSIASRVDYWQVVMKITLGSTPTRAGQNVAIFKAEPIGVIDSSDPEVCAGIENLRKICQMVLADFAKLVQASKTIRMSEMTDQDVIDSTLVDSTQNMPLPQSMANQAPTHQADMARLGMPAPQQPQQQPPTVVYQDPSQATPWVQNTAPTAPQQQYVPPQAPPAPPMPPAMTAQQQLPAVDYSPNAYEQQNFEVQVDPETGDVLHVINEQGANPNPPVPGLGDQNGEF